MKDKIIICAVELFNEHGINQTSFRDIASFLNISDGHTRYYFKTKEELLLSIFEQMNQDILAFVQNNETSDSGHYQTIRNQLIQVFTTMVNYRFFFEESPSTFNQYPKLTLAYQNLINARKVLFLGVFQDLINKGFFNKHFNSERQEKAFYSMFILSDSWIRYYKIMNNKKPDKDAIELHSDLVFSILLPYTTDEIN